MGFQVGYIVHAETICLPDLCCLIEATKICWQIWMLTKLFGWKYVLLLKMIIVEKLPSNFFTTFFQQTCGLQSVCWLEFFCELNFEIFNQMVFCVCICVLHGVSQNDQLLWTTESRYLQIDIYTILYNGDVLRRRIAKGCLFYNFHN